MKKIIILLFAIVLCGLQMQAQNQKSSTGGLSPNKSMEKSNSLPGSELDIDGEARLNLVNGLGGLDFYNSAGDFIGLLRHDTDNPDGIMYLSNFTGSGGELQLYSEGTITLYGAGQPTLIVDAAQNVGIGTDTPDAKFDVNGKIALTADINDEMVIINGDTWEHSSGPQTFNTGGDNFIMASNEGSGESAGIYGDGDAVTIWSPGDGVSGGTGALVAVCDEDRFDSTDTDPYNNTGLIWYLTESGGWIASDINRKENINAFTNSLDKISQLDVFTYNYKMNQAEVDKGQVNPEVVGIIAQDLHKVIPQAVNITENGEHFVNYNQVTPVLIGAINELSASNETLQAENIELKNRLAQLEAAVETLKRE